MTGLTEQAIRWHVNKRHLPKEMFCGKFVYSIEVVQKFFSDRLEKKWRQPGRPKGKA
jgi:hypothetical protein